MGIGDYLLKSCPRCKTGDMRLDKDDYGKYLHCCQCGYVKEVGIDTTPQVYRRATKNLPDRL